jgi:UrcA family protein
MPVRLPNIALIGLGLSLAGAAAAIEPLPSPLQPPPVDAQLNGVVVYAPRVIEQTKYGVLTQEYKMSARVPYSDLDMGSKAGHDELDRRVAKAADYLCRQLERLYPDGGPDRRTCAREAIGEAEPQVILAQHPG